MVAGGSHPATGMLVTIYGSQARGSFLPRAMPRNAVVTYAASEL